MKSYSVFLKSVCYGWPAKFGMFDSRTSGFKSFGTIVQEKCDDLEENPVETLPFPLGTQVSCENSLNTNPIKDGLDGKPWARH